MATSYQKSRDKGQRDEVQDALEACVRDGARRMLAVALEEEVNGFLRRSRYQRRAECFVATGMVIIHYGR